MKRLFPRRKLNRWHWLLITYLILLAISHLLRWINPPSFPPQPGQKVVELPEAGRERNGSPLRIAYRDEQPDSVENPPVVLLLHGSPVGVPMFYRFLPALAARNRVVAPDLPGYDASSRDLPDLSMRFQAEAMKALIKKLDLRNVHLVAYSLGGGPAIYLTQMHPERIASLTLLSAIGVQEFELLGDYYLNHSLHGVQLALLWMLHELTPHMGLLDRFPLNIPYARNFFESDQRPLRAIIQKITVPTLILHSPGDKLAPLAAAQEHHRLIPQSELILKPGGHGMVINRAEELAGDISHFIRQVQAGRAPDRAHAAPERIALAAQPLNPGAVPEAEGITLFVFIILIALATLVSEDLACIGAGLMAARGMISLEAAIFAAFLGIFVGDMLLYLAGRWLGKKALRHPPLRWWIKEEDIERSSQWFAARGPAIILMSRFLPGSRLPTYFGAGMFGAGFWMFTFYFGIAAAVWTPVLVGLSSLIGARLLDYYYLFEDYALPVLLLVILLMVLLMKLVVPLFSYRGRRLLRASWRRKVRWEFWPPYLFYLPVIGYILYLGLRFRSLTLFTAANPAIPASGFVGESKAQILSGLSGAKEALAAYLLIPASAGLQERIEMCVRFQKTLPSPFPVVLKPDIGERGKGVLIARDETAVQSYLQTHPENVIAQEYVGGAEYGVFYYRYPSEKRGHIFAITDKRFLTLRGDGKHTLEELILRDERAMCMAPFHFRQHSKHLYDTPAAGQEIPLVELGTHCRGSLFLDGAELITPELEAAIDRISRQFHGFYFGRYDLKTPSAQALMQGRDFKIIELNGVTSEAANIYDPANRLKGAYATLFRQWRIAFEIGVENRQRGVKPVSVSALIKLILSRSSGQPPHV